MIEGKKQFAFNMSDIKNAENYFVLVFCWFSAQKTILLLPENQQKTTRIVFSIFYVWHDESELFFWVGAHISSVFGNSKNDIDCTEIEL